MGVRGGSAGREPRLLNKALIPGLDPEFRILLTAQIRGLICSLFFNTHLHSWMKKLVSDCWGSDYLKQITFWNSFFFPNNYHLDLQDKKVLCLMIFAFSFITLVIPKAVPEQNASLHVEQQLRLPFFRSWRRVPEEPFNNLHIAWVHIFCDGMFLASIPNIK